MTTISSQTPLLSVVTTMYRSADFVTEFYERITAAANLITTNYEVIFVNDGSPDSSLTLALALIHSDSKVRVIDLSRNFGHHQAILAGLRHVRGEFTFLIDIDLEEQPEWLADFWRELHSTAVDVVYGVQTVRGGSVFKRHTGTLFYKFFNLTSETTIPENQCTVRLMNHSYLNALIALQERNVFLAGLFSWTGFLQHPYYVTKQVRSGKSSYTPVKLARLFLNAITSFSSYPLTLIFLLGTCITLLSVAYALRLFVRKLLLPDTVLSGFTSLMISLWFIGGSLISILGIIGIYTGKIFNEVKSRPQYFIRATYEQPRLGPAQKQ